MNINIFQQEQHIEIIDNEGRQKQVKENTHGSCKFEQLLHCDQSCPKNSRNQAFVLTIWWGVQRLDVTGVMYSAI